jgi:16S rRNA (guanine527-N7)-methyltransferase
VAGLHPEEGIIRSSPRGNFASSRRRSAAIHRTPFHVKRAALVTELERRLERHQLACAAAEPLATLIEALATPVAPTSVHDPRAALDIHIADSLSGFAVPELRVAAMIADLGAGGGLPGLVVAAVRPEARVVLVESLRRKGDFLRKTAAAMGLENVEVVTARAEEWADGRNRCDVVTARALASLPVLYEYAAPLLRIDGLLVAWKGEVAADEAAHGTAAAGLLGLAETPALAVRPFAASERRTIWTARKTAPTPPEFPRRPGIATKRPLSVKNVR